jgi:hypothetical protein
MSTTPQLVSLLTRFAREPGFVAEHLLDLRLRRELTVAEHALILGLSVEAYVKLGLCRMPLGAEQMRQVAEYAGLPVEELTALLAE